MLTRVGRNCAFVNFTNISNAIKAIDGVKNKPDYANLRIAHGKDRCANPPRSGPQGGASARRSASGNGPASAGPLPSDEGDAVDEQLQEHDGINGAANATGVVVEAPEEAALIENHVEA